MNFTPRPWQEPMIDFGLRTKRCMLGARMGMGKSSGTLSIVDTLLKAREIRKALVIAPLRVARSTWPEEVKKWEQFRHIKVQTITGSLNERVTALRNDKADLYCVNYDVVPWLVEHLAGEWPWDMVVADESSKLKGARLKQGGKRAGALASIAHTKVKRWLNLTGTPAPNGLADLWGQMYFIDAGKRLGRSYDAFESRWFGYQRAKDAVNAHRTRIARVAFPHAQEEITGLIKDVAMALNPKDWFDIKAPIVERVYVDMPPDARAKYREMEREMFTHIKGFDIEAFASSAKVIKLQQLSAGCIYTGSDEQIEKGISHWVEAHDAKLEALDSIVEEMGGAPVLVVYHFKPDLARLKKRYPNGRHINTKQDEDDFKAGRIPVAFVHPQSIGHGVDGFQKVCNTIIFFALDWNLETHDQIIERIGPMRQMQAGMDREVVIYLILARGTVDETIDARLIKKRGVQDATMDTLAFKGEPLWA